MPGPQMPNPIVMNILDEHDPILRLGMIGLFRLFTSLHKKYHDTQRLIYSEIRDLFQTGRLCLSFVDEKGEIDVFDVASFRRPRLVEIIEMRLKWSDVDALNTLAQYCHGGFDNAADLGLKDKNNVTCPGGIAIWPGFPTDPMDDSFLSTIRMHQALNTYFAGATGIRRGNATGSDCNVLGCDVKTWKLPKTPISFEVKPVKPAKKMKGLIWNTNGGAVIHPVWVAWNNYKAELHPRSRFLGFFAALAYVGAWTPTGGVAIGIDIPRVSYNTINDSFNGWTGTAPHDKQITRIGGGKDSMSAAWILAAMLGLPPGGYQCLAPTTMGGGNIENFILEIADDICPKIYNCVQQLTVAATKNTNVKQLHFIPVKQTQGVKPETIVSFDQQFFHNIKNNVPAYRNLEGVHACIRSDKYTGLFPYEVTIIRNILEPMMTDQEKDIRDWVAEMTRCLRGALYAEGVDTDKTLTRYSDRLRKASIGRDLIDIMRELIVQSNTGRLLTSDKEEWLRVNATKNFTDTRSFLALWVLLNPNATNKTNTNSTKENADV